MNLGLWSIVVCCLFASSIEPILVKIGFLGGAAPVLLIVLRTLVAGICVTLIGGKKFLRSMNFEQYKKILPIAVLLLLTNSLTISALKFSNPSLVITIITLTPAFVGIFSHFLGYELIDKNFWVGVFCCFLGVFTAINAQLELDFASNIKGIIFAFLAVLSSTTYRILLGKMTKQIHPQTITSYIFLNNGFVVLLALPFLYQSVTWKIDIISIWTGVAAVCANMAFVYAVKQIGAARMSIVDLMQRPVVVCFSMVLLGEAITGKQMIGIALVCFGVYFANSKKKRPKRLTELA